MFLLGCQFWLPRSRLSKVVATKSVIAFCKYYGLSFWVRPFDRRVRIVVGYPAVSSVGALARFSALLSLPFNTLFDRLKIVPGPVCLFRAGAC